ncbi:hypothetical protein GCM10020001_113520 [Nonomuraea salmonea]
MLHSWLTALTRGMPFVTWAYSAGTEDDRKEPSLDVRCYDAVLGPDGQLREGALGGHGEAFVLPDELPQDDPEKNAADSLRVGGSVSARSR